MLRRLSADQRRAGLPAALCHPFYDSGNLFRIIFAAGNIIQEKQRFSPCAGNIVDTHGHTVDSHSVMLIHKEGQL